VGTCIDDKGTFGHFTIKGEPSRSPVKPGIDAVPEEIVFWHPFAYLKVRAGSNCVLMDDVEVIHNGLPST
jgi:hypothetical protein